MKTVTLEYNEEFSTFHFNIGGVEENTFGYCTIVRTDRDQANKFIWKVKNMEEDLERHFSLSEIKTEWVNFKTINDMLK